MGISYFIRPENHPTIGPILGPFDRFVQIISGELLVGPNGDTVARLDRDTDSWHFEDAITSTNWGGPGKGSGCGRRSFPLPVADYSTLAGCGAEDWKTYCWPSLVIWGEPATAPR